MENEQVQQPLQKRILFKAKVPQKNSFNTQEQSLQRQGFQPFLSIGVLKNI